MSSDPLVAYPVIISFPLHWGEMDAFQHVNNVWFFRYFETVRLAYHEALGQALRSGDFGPILAETACRYKIPLTFPDTLRVGARTTGWYNFGFFHEYALVSERHQALAARGSARIVTYDYGRKVKVPIPEALLHAINLVERRTVPKSTAPLGETAYE